MNFIADRAMSEKIFNRLKFFGTVYKSYKLDIKDMSVSTHPDMQIHFLNEDTAVCSPETYEYYCSILPSHINLICGKSRLGDTYPNNCAYNIARVGMFIICNTRYADNEILDFYKKNSYVVIDVKQGYAKCNICEISDKTFITEDKGIYNSVINKSGITPILIDAGDVRLRGFDYGFIGGASGRFKDNVFFCGSPKYLRDFEKVTDALDKEGITYTELDDSQLVDCGGIIAFS